MLPRLPFTAKGGLQEFSVFYRDSRNVRTALSGFRNGLCGQFEREFHEFSVRHSDSLTQKESRQSSPERFAIMPPLVNRVANPGVIRVGLEESADDGRRDERLRLPFARQVVPGRLVR